MNARSIARYLQLAYSTVTKILRRLCLKKKTLKREKAHRYEYEHPGDMLHLDIKKLQRFITPGHKFGAPAKANTGHGIECAHVCIDGHSRWAFVEVLPDEKKEPTQGFIHRALEHFSSLGIAVNRLMTDNGPAYRSKFVNRYLDACQIKHVFTKPYRPQTNGKAARFIQTLSKEWAFSQPYQTSDERNKTLPKYLNHYNLSRTHSALGESTTSC